MTGKAKFMIVVVAVLFISLLPSFFDLVCDREMHRRESVRAWNCQHYGDAINAHYGREICPPTERG